MILILTLISGVILANNNYSWMNDGKINRRVLDIPSPKGYKRTNIKKDSFADWLRHLPLKKKNAQVYLHNGNLKLKQFVHNSVIDIDVGKRDLQQCADAVMRLRAEYLFSRNFYKEISFKFTSGDEYTFNDWKSGKYPKIKKNKVTWIIILPNN
jgi:hypothetical protein